ncbi:alpha/beta hydrolase [Emticicia fluvialis]|uniref:alpha/beta hydrolase n=1 Tax=Emticicia fluvialis TaxID=2974474 RepID=UPI00216589CA|nr:alpha/beta hydrolase [Emticicia fluvialis]
MIHKSFFETDPKRRKVFFQQWLPEQQADGIIALVHGLGEHSGRYENVAEFFTAHNYGVIAVDTYGHGQTTGKRGHAESMEAYMQQIERLLTLSAQTVPQKPVFLYGHSMGGTLVLNYLFRYHPSIAGVIATSPAVRPGFAPPKLLLAIGRLARMVAPSFTQSNSLDLNYLSHDPGVMAAYKADPLVHNQVSGVVGLGLIEWGEWLLGNARATPAPLLLIHGTEDRLTSYSATKELASKLSGDVTFKSYDKLYHELHNEFEKYDILNDLFNWIKARS